MFLPGEAWYGRAHLPCRFLTTGGCTTRRNGGATSACIEHATVIAGVLMRTCMPLRLAVGVQPGTQAQHAQ